MGFPIVGLTWEHDKGIPQYGKGRSCPLWDMPKYRALLIESEGWSYPHQPMSTVITAVLNKIYQVLAC